MYQKFDHHLSCDNVTFLGGDIGGVSEGDSGSYSSGNICESTIVYLSKHSGSITRLEGRLISDGY